jgi:hypothetical protein
VGIQILYRLDDVLFCEQNMGGKTAQKYVESPLLAPVPAATAAVTAAATAAVTAAAAAAAPAFPLHKTLFTPTPKLPEKTLQTKFDLRVWVLVTSFQPLRAFVFTTMYGRRCSDAYASNVKSYSKTYAHLTNYSINKRVMGGGAAKSAANGGAGAGGKRTRKAPLVRQNDSSSSSSKPAPVASQTSGAVVYYADAKAEAEEDSAPHSSVSASSTAKSSAAGAHAEAEAEAALLSNYPTFHYPGAAIADNTNRDNNDDDEPLDWDDDLDALMGTYNVDATTAEHWAALAAEDADSVTAANTKTDATPQQPAGVGIAANVIKDKTGNSDGSSSSGAPPNSTPNKLRSVIKSFRGGPKAVAATATVANTTTATATAAAAQAQRPVFVKRELGDGSGGSFIMCESDLLLSHTEIANIVQARYEQLCSGDMGRNLLAYHHPAAAQALVGSEAADRSSSVPSVPTATATTTARNAWDELVWPEVKRKIRIIPFFSCPVQAFV